jgi:hypothetical protein
MRHGPLEFALDLLAVGCGFIVPSLWLTGQVVALIALRGRLRWLATVPLVVMLSVIPTTYRAWHADSNLWPIFFILASFPAGIAIGAVLVIGKPKLSNELIGGLMVAILGLTATAMLHSAAGSHRHRVAEQRQSKEADAIIRALDAVVPVGMVQTSDPAALDAETARSVVTKSGIVYNACYRQGLALDPHLGGPLVIEMGIAADGHVATAGVRQSRGAVSVERCIVEGLRKLEFPKSGSAAPGATTSLTIPMQLRPPSTATR